MSKETIISIILIGIFCLFKAMAGNSGGSSHVKPSYIPPQSVQKQSASPNNATTSTNQMVNTSAQSSSQASVTSSSGKIIADTYRISNMQIEYEGTNKATIYCIVENVKSKKELMIISRGFVLRKPGRNTVNMLAGYYNSGDGPNSSDILDIYPNDKVKIVMIFKVPDEISGYTLNYTNYTDKLYPIVEIR